MLRAVNQSALGRDSLVRASLASMAMLADIVTSNDFLTMLEHHTD
jgi:hypothetical protein